MNVEITDGVGTIWLNRPPANSLNREVVEELALAFVEINSNDEAKVLRKPSPAMTLPKD